VRFTPIKSNSPCGGVYHFIGRISTSNTIVSPSKPSNLKRLQLGTLHFLGFPAKAISKQNSTAKLQNFQLWGSIYPLVYFFKNPVYYLAYTAHKPF